MISYELQTFLGGVWKIDSVYDDREIAVYEAQRLHAGNRFSAVRVVEEKFSPDAGKTVSKTVFRAAKTDETNVESMENQKAARREVRAAKKTAPTKETRTAAVRPAPAKKSGPGGVALTLMLGAIVLAGIAAILGLRYMFGAA